jgi:hypothetical protein
VQIGDLETLYTSLLGSEGGETAFSESNCWISLIVPNNSRKDIRKENVNINAKVSSTKTTFLFSFIFMG